MSGESTDGTEQLEFGVNVEAYGPSDEPGETRYHEYVVYAEDEQSAKAQGIEKAKNHPTQSIVGPKDNCEIIEVIPYDQYFEADTHRSEEGEQ